MAKPTAKARKQPPGAAHAKRPNPRLRDMGAPRLDRIAGPRIDPQTNDAPRLDPSPIGAQAPALQAGDARTLPATIIEFMESPTWAGSYFEGPTWAAWKTVLKAIYGLEMSQDDLDRFRELAGGRNYAPGMTQAEVLLVCGRRAGKSRMTALIAAWEALQDWTPWLQRGDMATILVLAKEKKQAAETIKLVKAVFLDHPVMRALVANETAEELELTNRCVIRVVAASPGGVRGFHCPLIIVDEGAFTGSDDEASPQSLDSLMTALRPSMLTFAREVNGQPGRCKLIMASSPKGRTGFVYELFESDYGKDAADCLVIRAPSWALNPAVPQAEIDRAYRRDPRSAAVEYGAEFNDAASAFITSNALAALVDKGVHERPPASGVRYRAHFDAAGGTGPDSFTFAIAHTDQRHRGVLDVVREWRPPFNPDSVAAEIATLCRRYRIAKIVGDSFGAGLTVQTLARQGVHSEKAPLDRSGIYLEFLPICNTGSCVLLDHPRMVEQFLGLIRKPGRLKDIVDHAPKQHDDIANSVAGVIVATSIIDDEGSVHAGYFSQIGARERDPSKPWGIAEPAPAPEVEQAIKSAIDEIERLERAEGITSWFDPATRSVQGRGPAPSEILRTLWQANAAERREHLRLSRIGPPDANGVAPEPPRTIIEPEDPNTPAYRAGSNAVLRDLLGRANPNPLSGLTPSGRSPLGISFDPSNWKPRW